MQASLWRIPDASEAEDSATAPQLHNLTDIKPAAGGEMKRWQEIWTKQYFKLKLTWSHYIILTCHSTKRYYLTVHIQNYAGIKLMSHTNESNLWKYKIVLNKSLSSLNISYPIALPLKQILSSADIVVVLLQYDVAPVWWEQWKHHSVRESISFVGYLCQWERGKGEFYFYLNL